MAAGGSSAGRCCRCARGRGGGSSAGARGAARRSGSCGAVAGDIESTAIVLVIGRAGILSSLVVWMGGNAIGIGLLTCEGIDRSGIVLETGRSSVVAGAVPAESGLQMISLKMIETLCALSRQDLLRHKSWPQRHCCRGSCKCSAVRYTMKLSSRQYTSATW